MGTMAAGLEGIIAGESEICYIDGDRGVLSYRGYNIHTLADNAIFEEVVFLLWNGWLPKQAELDRLKQDLVAERDLPGPVIDFLRQVSAANPMDVLRTAVSMLSLYDSEAADMSAEANHRKAVRLMSRTATIVTGSAYRRGPATGLCGQLPVHSHRQTAGRPHGARVRCGAHSPCGS